MMTVVFPSSMLGEVPQITRMDSRLSIHPGTVLSGRSGGIGTIKFSRTAQGSILVAPDDQFALCWERVSPNESELIPLVNEYLVPFVEEVTIHPVNLIRVSVDGNSLLSSTGMLADSNA